MNEETVARKRVLSKVSSGSEDPRPSRGAKKAPVVVVSSERSRCLPCSLVW